MNRDFSQKAAWSMDEMVAKRRMTRREQKEMLTESDTTFFGFKPSELIEGNPCKKIHGSEVINDYLQENYYSGINNKSDCVLLRVCNSSIS